jgi:putative membrane protein
MVIDAQGHARIVASIRAAEAKTAGEIFVVVARASDDYRLLPFLFAALATLLGGLVAAIIAPGIAAGSLALAEAGVFAVLAAVALLPKLGALLTPRAIRTARASARAREQFLAHNIHATPSRTGVLIFVSLAERHAEIVADTAIDQKVKDTFWRETVDALTAAIAKGRLAEGLVAAVAACGDALAEHFPRSLADQNELPDKLVEL